MHTVSKPPLFKPVTLPNGSVLQNRVIKSAMSDALADGTGAPTEAQARLYERWAEGGVAASIIGEVQVDPSYPENPGNLVLNSDVDLNGFRALAQRGSKNSAQLWLQLGHAGALSYASISRPKGPSTLEFPDLRSAEMSLAEIKQIPEQFAQAARRAADCGFGGVQIHAAHGFLLSQFLSPLFNHRTDAYGGSIQARMRLLIETVEATRASVPPGSVVAVKLNASDQLDGGLLESEALKVVAELEGRGVDLLDISGGTYFPGAPASSERVSKGPYFLEFTRAARALTSIPLMATGGFKRKAEAEAAIAAGDVDIVGLARAFVLDPSLPRHWEVGDEDPVFPRFKVRPPGGMTAWYTMRMADIGADRESQQTRDLERAMADYETGNQRGAAIWKAKFGIC